MALLAPSLWLEFFQRVVFERFNAGIVATDNCSLANLCFFIVLFTNKCLGLLGLSQLQLTYIKEFGLAVYALLLCAMVIADLKIRSIHKTIAREHELVLTLMYLPFMIAVPETSYHYNLVLLILLIPVLCYLSRSHYALPRLIIWLLAGGFFLTQLPVHILQELFKTNGAFFYFFPSLGLFLVMVGCVVFKFWFALTGSPAHTTNTCPAEMTA